MMMNLAIRISSLAAGLTAADDGPAGRNEWQNQARKLPRADFDGKTRPPPCHFKRLAQLRAIMTGQDNCHRTGIAQTGIDGQQEAGGAGATGGAGSRAGRRCPASVLGRAEHQGGGRRRSRA
jgi:hypothetical protein